MVKKFDDMFSGVDRIPACDGQTDGRQTSCVSIVSPVHTRRAVKTCISCTVRGLLTYKDTSTLPYIL